MTSFNMATKSLPGAYYPMNIWQFSTKFSLLFLVFFFPLKMPSNNIVIAEFIHTYM